MTDNQQAAEEIVEVVARAIKLRAVETADADESEQWFAEQFATAALAAARPLIEAETREKAAKVAEEAYFASGMGWAPGSIAQSIRSMGGSDHG